MSSLPMSAGALQPSLALQPRRDLGRPESLVATETVTTGKDCDACSNGTSAWSTQCWRYIRNARMWSGVDSVRSGQARTDTFTDSSEFALPAASSLNEEVPFHAGLSTRHACLASQFAPGAGSRSFLHQPLADGARLGE